MIHSYLYKEQSSLSISIELGDEADTPKPSYKDHIYRELPAYSDPDIHFW